MQQYWKHCVVVKEDCSSDPSCLVQPKILGGTFFTFFENCQRTNLIGNGPSPGASKNPEKKAVIDWFYCTHSYQPRRGTSLEVQQLKLCASNARGSCSIPGQGTKILNPVWCSQHAIIIIINPEETTVKLCFR